MLKTFFFIATLLFTSPLLAQTDASPADTSLISLSGIVFSTDSIVALPYVSIFVNQLPKGTISDSYGFFSLQAHPTDTLTFTAVGYKTAQFVVPDYLVGQQYSVVQGMVRDTIVLQEVMIYSMPTTSEFMESFSDNNLGFEQRIDSMQTELRDVLEEDIILGKYEPIDVNDGITRMYSVEWGLVPPNNFLNPIRWTQFVRDLRKKQSRQR
jgi:hypothetical protein